MKSKVGLSYSLGTNKASGNHILPISAISVREEAIFTGGRDGVVKIWSRDPVAPYTTRNSQWDSEDDDLDTQLLKLEQSISSSPLTHPGHPSSPQLDVVQSYPLHFDWINDIQLVNNGQSLVSCSSDLSIKLVDIETGHMEKFANAHTDYIKKLSWSATKPTVIFSAGLDGNIIEWDLSQMVPSSVIKHRTTTSPQSSVYSLAHNDQLVAAGGPSNTINLYDPRKPAASAFIHKMIGHQDTIRTLAMNDVYVVSGSSDTTIKVWDIRTLKLVRTIDVHDHPVWSIATEQPGELRWLYSGDRSGRIVKTDLSQVSPHNSAPAKEFATFTQSEATLLDGNIGVSAVVAEDAGSVLALGVSPNIIYASTSYGISQYSNPELSQVSRYQYLRRGLEHLIDREGTEDLDLGQGGGDDIQSEFYDLISHLSMETGPVAGMDAQSLFSGAGLVAHDTADSDDDQDMTPTMFLDVDGGTSSLFINSFIDHDYDDIPKQENGINGSLTQSWVEPTPVEIVTHGRPSSYVIPFNSKPISMTRVVPLSVVAKRVLNNKRQVLALYSNGDIATWDLLTCSELPSRWHAIDNAAHGGLDDRQLEKRTKDMDALFGKLQTNEVLSNWCEVEIKAGKLMVTVKESSFCNVEAYYDDLVKSYPYLSLDAPENQALADKHVQATNEDRYIVSQVLMNSFFHDYAVYEWVFDRSVREELRMLKGGVSPVVASNGSVESGSGIKKFFGKRKSREDPSDLASLSSLMAKGISHELVDQFIHEEIPVPPRPPHFDESVYILLYTNKKIYEENYDTSTYKPGTLVDSALRVDQIDPRYRDCSKEESLVYQPIIPSYYLPQDLQIMLFEYSSDLGNYRELQSFLFSEVNSNDNIAALRRWLPRWIGRPILYNRLPQRDIPKLSFTLVEIDYEQIDPSKKIGGKSQKKIKKLPLLESSIKLASHNMLRVSKICLYLTDKFESKTSEMKSGKMPTEWLVLECRGIELEPQMTLQTIKATIWKSSSDIELQFRRKFDK